VEAFTGSAFTVQPATSSLRQAQGLSLSKAAESGCLFSLTLLVGQQVIDETSNGSAVVYRSVLIPSIIFSTHVSLVQIFSRL
jgi:uncharacterized protein YfiM (DUF2279 family)